MFQVFREATRKGRAVLAWIPMRKGLADIARRVEVSRAANQRYLEALSVVQRPAPAPAVLDPVSRRVVKEGRAYRALRPITEEEATVFEAILKGEHLVQGFRNKDLRRWLAAADEEDPVRRRRSSGRITRRLRLLRARADPQGVEDQLLSGHEQRTSGDDHSVTDSRAGCCANRGLIFLSRKQVSPDLQYREHREKNGMMGLDGDLAHRPISARLTGPEDVRSFFFDLLCALCVLCGESSESLLLRSDPEVVSPG
jgi:hypothetical protein